MIAVNLLSTKAAAKQLGISVRTLNRWAESGKIVPAYKGEGKRGGYLYEPAAVEAVTAERVAS